MSPATHPASKEQHLSETVRRHRRTLFSVPISLCHLANGGVRSDRGITLDLSHGGMGAVVKGQLQIGDVVTIDLNLPAGKLHVVAIVRHTAHVRSGFEFLKLTPEDELLLASTIGQC